MPLVFLACFLMLLVNQSYLYFTILVIAAFDLIDCLAIGDIILIVGKFIIILSMYFL